MTAPAPQAYVQGQTQTSADNLNTFVQNANNVAGLRAFIGVTGNAVVILGFSTPNDGGQGHFYWNASSTHPDDGGVTTVVPQGASGAWTRLTGV